MYNKVSIIYSFFEFWFDFVKVVNLFVVTGFAEDKLVSVRVCEKTFVLVEVVVCSVKNKVVLGIVEVVSVELDFEYNVISLTKSNKYCFMISFSFKSPLAKTGFISF